MLSQIIALSIAFGIGIFYLTRFHPYYQDRKKTFDQRHTEFTDDYLGLDQQIRECRHFHDLLDLEFKIDQFQWDHQNFINDHELTKAIHKLTALWREKELTLRKTNGLYATS